MYLSNFLEKLIELFTWFLYETKSHPWAKRLLILPDVSIKGFLQQKIAKDPRFRVMTGMKWMTLSEALGMPSSLELSFFLEIQILEKLSMEDFSSVRRYVEGPSRNLRLSQLIDQLTSLFLRYSKYGKAPCLQFRPDQTWQSILWKEVNKYWPSISLEYEQLYLFGFNFLPKSLLDWALEQKALCWFFSPCRVFWGDHYSEKERIRIQRNLSLTSRQEYEASFQEQNRLLANWGKLGRKMHNQLIEYQVEEHYVCPEEETALSQLQRRILFGEKTEKIPKDSSLQVWSTYSRWEEVELLKKKIKEWLWEGLAPCEIQVFAPDISLYFPYIRTVFADQQIEISIEDIPSECTDSFLQAFHHLLSLPKENFSRSVMFTLFSFPRFSERFQLTKAEILQMEKWCLQGHVRCFETDLKRLLIETTQRDGVLQQSDLELFDTFYCIVTSLMTTLCTESRSIADWVDAFVSWSKAYLVVEGHESFFQRLQQIKKTFPDRSILISYESACRMLIHFMKKRTKIHVSHLQVVRFSSLPQGIVWPSKGICLLGMHEGAFPRSNHSYSLSASVDSPLQSEEDRYLFLQLLCSARKIFFVSYPKQLLGEVGEISPSLPLQELIEEISLPIVSFVYEKNNKKIINSSFISKIEFPKIIEIKKLLKLIKDPDKFFLHETLGIYEQREIDESEEFILSPLKKYLLCKEAVKTPLETLLEKAQQQGELPSYLFKEVAIKKITEEYETHLVSLKEMGIDRKEIFSITLTHVCKEKERLPNGDWIFPPYKVCLTSGQEIELIGKIEEVTCRGLLLRSKGTLSDQIKAWPLYVIYRLLFPEGGRELFFLKKAKRSLLENGDLSMHLCLFLEYYYAALQSSSPLNPETIEAILLNKSIEIEENWKQWALKLYEFFSKLCK